MLTPRVYLVGLQVGIYSEEGTGIEGMEFYFVGEHFPEKLISWSIWSFVWTTVTESHLNDSVLFFFTTTGNFFKCLQFCISFLLLHNTLPQRLLFIVLLISEFPWVRSLSTA